MQSILLANIRNSTHLAPRGPVRLCGPRLERACGAGPSCVWNWIRIWGAGPAVGLLRGAGVWAQGTCGSSQQHRHHLGHSASPPGVLRPQQQCQQHDTCVAQASFDQCASDCVHCIRILIVDESLIMLLQCHDVQLYAEGHSPLGYRCIFSEPYHARNARATN
jgi:hypothetical protein